MGLLVEVAPAARLHRDSSTCGAVAIALGCARLSSRDRPWQTMQYFSASTYVAVTRDHQSRGASWEDATDKSP